MQDITIQSEKGGILKILNPFTNQIEERNTKPGEVIKLTQWSVTYGLGSTTLKIMWQIDLKNNSERTFLLKLKVYL